MKFITESEIEDVAIEYLHETSKWEFQYGVDISPEGEQSVRENYEPVLLLSSVEQVIAKSNPSISPEAQRQASQALQRIDFLQLLTNNKQFHLYLTEGIPVRFRMDERERDDNIQIIDFEPVENKEYLAINQLMVVERKLLKRPDIVLFVNVIPLVVIELINPSDENTTVRKANNQMQTYKEIFISLFTFNTIGVISDGLECRAGSISSDFMRSWHGNPLVENRVFKIYPSVRNTYQEDAESVMSCDYKDSSSQTKGIIKCEGAIDTKVVREAITLVIEGGEKAFKLRKNKYGF